jgi:hypothetical protein
MDKMQQVLLTLSMIAMVAFTMGCASSGPSTSIRCRRG